MGPAEIPDFSGIHGAETGLRPKSVPGIHDVSREQAIQTRSRVPVSWAGDHPLEWFPFTQASGHADG